MLTSLYSRTWGPLKFDKWQIFGKGTVEASQNGRKMGILGVNFEGVLPAVTHFYCKCCFSQKKLMWKVVSNVCAYHFRKWAKESTKVTHLGTVSCPTVLPRRVWRRYGHRPTPPTNRRRWDEL